MSAAEDRAGVIAALRRLADFLEANENTPGWRVDIVVPAADAGTEAGQKTVTIWKPKPEIAALLAKPAEGGESA